MKIICKNIGNVNELTLNKEYEVIRGDDYWWWIINDNGKENGYNKLLFDEVIEKEYTIMELLDFPVGTKFKDNEGYIVKVKEMAYNGHKKLCFDSDNNDLIISTGWRDAKFTMIEEPKPVEFITAWKEFENGKTIESTYTLDRYKKIDGLINIQHQGGEFYKCGNIATSEIGNAWIIVD